jgi:predicted aconitase
MAASGAVALYHIEGITPEAIQRNMIKDSVQTVTIDSLKRVMIRSIPTSRK